MLTFSRIWLEDVETELTKAGNTNLDLIGFDISSTLFPQHPKIPFKFVVQDVLKDFPEEYLNSFDVVHMRLVFLALTIDQVKPAVDNLIKLLSQLPPLLLILNYYQLIMGQNQEDTSNGTTSTTAEVRTLPSRTRTPYPRDPKAPYSRPSTPAKDGPGESSQKPVSLSRIAR